MMARFRSLDTNKLKEAKALFTAWECSAAVQQPVEQPSSHG